MANKMYGLFGQALLDRSLSAAFGSLNIKIALVTSGYTPNFTTDQYMNTVQSSGGVLGRSANLTSVTTTLGVFNHADTSVTPGSSGTAAAAVYFVDTGTDSTSPLICYDDTGTGLPYTATSGAAITIKAPTTSAHVFQIPN